MVLYADDILIIAPSVNELQHLVNICELELAALDMLTNAKKSCCLRIGPRHNIECSHTASGHIIPWVDNNITKTAKIKKVLLLRSTLTLWRRAAKVIAPF